MCNWYSCYKNDFFIVNKIYTGWRDLNFDFTLKDCLFGGVKVAKNADPEKFVYSGHGIGFDSDSRFSLTDGSICKKFPYFWSWYELICAYCY